MRRLLWCAAVLAALASSEAAAGPRTDEAMVRDLWRRFEERYNRRDADGIAQLYAADADRLASQERAQGRAAIREQYVRELAEAAALKADPVHDAIVIRFLRPDVAVIDGEGPDVSDEGPVTVLYTVVVVRDHGQWWIAAGRPRGAVPRPAPTKP